MKPPDPVLIRPAELIALPNEVQHHDHDHHQLIIALKGYSEFSIEGSQSLILPGQGCVVTASSEHAFNGVGESEILTLNLTNEASLDKHTSERIQPMLFSGNQYFKIDNQFQCLLDLLVKEMRGAPDDLLVADACKNTIVALIQRHIYTDLPSKFMLRNRINMTIIDNYILQHIASKITVAQLAGCVFLGESHFHVLFKQQVGITPHQHILKMRFNLAKKLLEDSSLTLATIASTSGFANQSSFTHSFTKLQGTSPSKYRK
tara:strand:- start:6404 stop:7186 length:783 start_codon:yes stop_codon:yes gene_type:complete